MKILNKGIIYVIVFLVLLFGVKIYCDQIFLCSDEQLAVAVLEGEPINKQSEYLNSQTYSHCRFLELKTYLINEDYISFEKLFNDFYQNYCNDDSRFLAFRTVFCDSEDLTKQELEVLLSVLETAYEYDFSNYGYDANHLLQFNLLLQIDLLYSTGHPFQAYQKKSFLETYVENYTMAMKGG